MRQSLMPCPERPPQRQHWSDIEIKWPRWHPNTSGQTKHMITAKEGQAVWFFIWQWRRRNRNHRFWCPSCSWTLQIGAWGRQRYPLEWWLAHRASHRLVATLAAKFLSSPATTANGCLQLLVTYLIRSVHHSVPATWTNFFASAAGWMNKQDLL